MTTGRLPFEGETYFQTIEAIKKRAPSAIKKQRKDAPDALVTIIDRTLKKDPADRYQLASDIANDLRTLTKGRATDDGLLG
jgi:serine/threonine protein kinase